MQFVLMDECLTLEASLNFDAFKLICEGNIFNFYNIIILSNKLIF